MVQARRPAAASRLACCRGRRVHDLRLDPAVARSEAAAAAQDKCRVWHRARGGYVARADPMPSALHLVDSSHPQQNGAAARRAAACRLARHRCDRLRSPPSAARARPSHACAYPSATARRVVRRSAAAALPRAPVQVPHRPLAQPPQWPPLPPHRRLPLQPVPPSFRRAFAACPPLASPVAPPAPLCWPCASHRWLSLQRLGVHERLHVLGEPRPRATARPARAAASPSHSPRRLRHRWHRREGRAPCPCLPFVEGDPGSRLPSQSRKPDGTEL